MIMILSCFDLLAVLINNPLMILIATLYLTKNVDAWNIRLEHVKLTLWVGNFFFGFSMLALLVMSFDRYLATYHPIFHRTSVTKGKLASLLLFIAIIDFTLKLISPGGFLAISVLIFLLIYTPPMFYLNFKLFAISRKSRKDRMADDRKKAFALKNVSSCLLAVICFVVLSIPSFVYVGLAIHAESTEFDLVYLVGMWTKTIVSMNSTFNCLIFYWKNKLLRTVGMKVIKGMSLRRQVQS